MVKSVEETVIRICQVIYFIGTGMTGWSYKWAAFSRLKPISKVQLREANYSSDACEISFVLRLLRLSSLVRFAIELRKYVRVEHCCLDRLSI